MKEVRISSNPAVNASVYKLLQPIVQVEPAAFEAIRDRVTISPQSVARRLPTTLDSVLNFPQHLSSALSMAGTVISWLAGPLGIVLGSISVAAIPTSIVACKMRRPKMEGSEL